MSVSDELRATVGLKVAASPSPTGTPDRSEGSASGPSPRWPGFDPASPQTFASDFLLIEHKLGVLRKTEWPKSKIKVCKFFSMTLTLTSFLHCEVSVDLNRGPIGSSRCTHVAGYAI